MRRLLAGAVIGPTLLAACATPTAPDAPPAPNAPPSNTPTMTATHEAQLARWREQYDHWANVDALKASMVEVNADRIVDAAESRHICFALAQWTSQMRAARDYVGAFREADPETVEFNPSLGNLESEAERALGLLGKVECQ